LKATVEVKKKVLVALGGNAILRHKEKGTAEEQFENVRRTCETLADLVREGYRIAITHGNGPQVGDILLKNEMAKNSLPPMPLDVCGAESQGMIGYMLQQSLQNEFRRLKLDLCVATVITQTLVDQKDPAFQNPTKPIGPFYTAMEASKLRQKKNWTNINDSGRGYRRVVPSPDPKFVVESFAVKQLFSEGVLVIACGGGGIPVVLRGEDGTFEGVEAVIDKDYTAATLATCIGAEVLLILTDVDRVFLNYGKPDQKGIARMTLEEAKSYLAEGHFAPGSMRPKIESAIKFVESGGEKTIITSIEKAKEALEGKAGTVVA
jgi:carbamate kinase